jgi:phage repressor protein C with HTH and peptisase S24 domain
MAARSGMSTSGYAHYENPMRFKSVFLPMGEARLFAQALDGTSVDASEVMALAGAADSPVGLQPRPSVSPDDRLIPVYDIAASAGYGAVVESEDVICNIAFDKRFLRRLTDAGTGDLSIIRVKGHSMEPTLLDDDHVLVDRTKRNLSYDGLFVLRFDDALHVKRIGRSATRGRVTVTSDHPGYRDLDMPVTDLDIIGRVLWVGRKV